MNNRVTILKREEGDITINTDHVSYIVPLDRPTRDGMTHLIKFNSNGYLHVFEDEAQQVTYVMQGGDAR